MEKEISEKKKKLLHPVAERLEAVIRKRLSEVQGEKNLSDAALGELSYAPLGYDDVQKKINNLMRGKTGMKLSDFYIVCEALGIQPDRVFSSALDGVLSQKAVTPEPEASSKNTDPKNKEIDTRRPILPAVPDKQSGAGAG